MNWPSWLDILKNEWPVIRSAPWSVATLVIMAVALAWTARWCWDRRRMALLKEQVAHKDRVIKDLRPTETAFNQLDNDTLRQWAFDLVRRLREFHREQWDQERSIREYDERMADHQWGASGVRLSNEAAGKRNIGREEYYNRHFKSDAVLLRNEILTRLPDNPPGGIYGPGGEYRIPDFALYGPLSNITQIEILATNLECLAKLLPPHPTGSSKLLRMLGKPRNFVPGIPRPP